MGPNQVPYISGVDGKGNLIYNTNVKLKVHTENKLREEHGSKDESKQGLEQRGQY